MTCSDFSARQLDVATLREAGLIADAGTDNAGTGRPTTVLRIDGGLHDLTLSPGPVRSRFYAELTRWLTAYGWAGSVA